MEGNDDNDDDDEEEEEEEEEELWIEGSGGDGWFMKAHSKRPILLLLLTPWLFSCILGLL